MTRSGTQIVELRAENFRRFEQLQLRFSNKLVCFAGDNAAGKTSLLEMLYVLGRGRSFRASAATELAGTAARSWTAFGRTVDYNEVGHALDVQWKDATTQLRLDSETVNSLALLRTLPIQVLEPGMHKILQDGPTYRRSFLDWGVFHVEPSFLDVWRRYRRAVRQRNEVLRAAGSDRALAAWEPEIAESGEILHRQRLAHLDALRPRIEQRLSEWMGGSAWQIDLHAGWQAGTSLQQALQTSRDRDRKLGSTASGPHRAELRIRLDAHGVRSRISRGQQKLLLATLLLAQSEEIHAVTGSAPVLLVDDFCAELASGFQQWLLSALRAYVGQVFLTSFGESAVLKTAALEMFHVEHGRVSPA